MEACLAALQHATEADSPGVHRVAAPHPRAPPARARGDARKPSPAARRSPRVSGSFGRAGPRGCVVDALELAAALLAIGQQAECAARLLGAASALRAAMPRLMSVREHAMLARDREAITAMIGEPAFTQAWTVGQEQPLARTVAEAQSALATLAR